jgi:uncharacterized membrane protein YcfT
MTGAKMSYTHATTPRFDWVDYAKGICIILVVLMHSTFGVEKAIGQTGYLHDFIAWAAPFRMPDFFLLSGLFLSRRISAPWRTYLDSKVVHFFYFYVLWMTLQFAVKGPSLVLEQGAAAAFTSYLWAFAEPFGTLWFIYVLAVFFVVTKALKNVSPIVVFIVAAILEMLPLHTGWMVVDEFASRYVYFFAGYWLAPVIFQVVAWVWTQKIQFILTLLLSWCFLHTALVSGGYGSTPFIGLVLGFAGAAAVIGCAILLARSGCAGGLRYLGANSLVIYLAFFLFMAATRTLLVKLMPSLDIDVLAAVITSASIIGPLLMLQLVRGSALGFLFQRPKSFSVMTVETPAKPTYTPWHDNSFAKPQTR